MGRIYQHIGEGKSGDGELPAHCKGAGVEGSSVELKGVWADTLWDTSRGAEEDHGAGSFTEVNKDTRNSRLAE